MHRDGQTERVTHRHRHRHRQIEQPVTHGSLSTTFVCLWCSRWMCRKPGNGARKTRPLTHPTSSFTQRCLRVPAMALVMGLRKGGEDGRIGYVRVCRYDDGVMEAPWVRWSCMHVYILHDAVLPLTLSSDHITDLCTASCRGVKRRYTA